MAAAGWFALAGNANGASDVEGSSTLAQRNLAALSAGSRRLADEGVEDGELISTLLRRSEANKERNAAIVKRATEANAFTAIDGSIDRRLVTNLQGKNVYLDAKEVRVLIQQRRLACAPSVMEPCRMVEPSSDVPLQLPEAKTLSCDATGRNCKFKSLD